MVEFGEELIVESLRIPWLIWIQLLVFFLLISLLYCFTVVSGEDNVADEDNVVISGETSSSNYSSSLTSSSSQKQPPVFQFQHQVGENQSLIRDATNSSSRGGGGSYYSNNNGGSRSSSSNQLHPCNIISLAKIAFLKCLGLDNTNTNVLDKDQINER